jgi:outer membrane protein assembly factor BamB
MTVKNNTVYKMRRALIACVAAGVVMACSSDGEDTVFEGDRISVLSYESQLRVDPRLAGEPVRLLPPFLNSQWNNPGGFATHVAYHLDLSGLTESFRVDMVAGNVADRRLKSPPVVGGGKVFAMGSNLEVSAVDGQTGAALWTTSVAATYREKNFGLTRFLGRSDVPADIDDGFGGGVAYEKGRVFVTTGFGEILALSAETGEIIWRVKNTVPFSNAPTIRKGNLFVVSQDSRLQVLSTEDGRRLWEFLAITEQASILASSSPAVSDQMVVAGFSSGEVASLSIVNGTAIWNDSLSSRATQVTPLSELNAIVGRPVIDRDRVFVTSHGGRTAAIDVRTGERIWTADVGSIETPWVIGDFVLVMSLDGDLVCLSREQGRVRWVASLGGYEDPEARDERIRWAGPVLAGGRALLASSDGRLASVDPTNGEITEIIDLEEAVSVAPIVANRTLYILTDEGSLIALR